MTETSYSDNRATLLSEQNNLTKESDVFNKLASEIEAGNASHIKSEYGQVNVNLSLTMNSLSGLNACQSLEDKDKFVGAKEDTSRRQQWF